ncbi:hypothetical protein D3C79_850840 [compost metagenome]
MALVLPPDIHASAKRNVGFRAQHLHRSLSVHDYLGLQRACGRGVLFGEVVQRRGQQRHVADLAQRLAQPARNCGGCGNEGRVAQLRLTHIKPRHLPFAQGLVKQRLGKGIQWGNAGEQRCQPVLDALLLLQTCPQRTKSVEGRRAQPGG